MRPLVSWLLVIQGKITDGKLDIARNLLETLVIPKLQGLIDDGVLTSEHGQLLLDLANQLLDQLP
jgi:hypothetical protein